MLCLWYSVSLYKIYMSPKVLIKREIVNLISKICSSGSVLMMTGYSKMLKIKVIIHRVILAARNTKWLLCIHLYVAIYNNIDSALKSDTIFYACLHKNNQPGRILSTRFRIYFIYISLSYETKEINFAH